MSTTVSKIEWCTRTWNPVRGCSRVSEGCRNCYAEKVAARFSGIRPTSEGPKPEPFHGFATMKPARWTGKVSLVESALLEPLSWRKPARIFVNSMSDLFHEALPDEAIDRVFAVMALAPRHTFQVLTKRAERMRRYLTERVPHWSEDKPEDREWHVNEAAISLAEGKLGLFNWPLPNVWLGVSVEDQSAADERIPHLLATPAAVRFVSAEPLLGPLDLRFGGHPFRQWMPAPGPPDPPSKGKPAWLDWVIAGGESGPGARPCDVAWIRSIVEQCRAAGVPAFVKQLGARPMVFSPPGTDDLLDELAWAIGNRQLARLRDRKGGDPSEWPEDLRVREFPEVRDAE